MPTLGCAPAQPQWRSCIGHDSDMLTRARRTAASSVDRP
jgi:hypothetical protein